MFNYVHFRNQCETVLQLDAFDASVTAVSCTGYWRNEKINARLTAVIFLPPLRWREGERRHLIAA